MASIASGRSAASRLPPLACLEPSLSQEDGSSPRGGLSCGPSSIGNDVGDQESNYSEATPSRPATVPFKGSPTLPPGSAGGPPGWALLPGFGNAGGSLLDHSQQVPPLLQDKLLLSELNDSMVSQMSRMHASFQQAMAKERTRHSSETLLMLR